MKHGSDPPSQKLGHKIPNNKNGFKLLRRSIWPFWYNVPFEETWGGITMWKGIILVHSNSNVYPNKRG
jgi:hypothetical protein